MRSVVKTHSTSIHFFDTLNCFCLLYFAVAIFLSFTPSLIHSQSCLCFKYFFLFKKNDKLLWYHQQIVFLQLQSVFFMFYFFLNWKWNNVIWLFDMLLKYCTVLYCFNVSVTLCSCLKRFCFIILMIICILSNITKNCNLSLQMVDTMNLNCFKMNF